MKQTMEQRLGWLKFLMEDEKALILDKVDGLLTVLGEVRKERGRVTKPMQDIVMKQQKIIAALETPFGEAEEHIKTDLWRILEEFVQGEKHDSDVGTAQIVRSKNRISYDTKGLETLRLSFKDVDQMIGHLRKESPSKPYLNLKVKLK